MSKRDASSQTTTFTVVNKKSKKNIKLLEDADIDIVNDVPVQQLVENVDNSNIQVDEDPERTEEAVDNEEVEPEADNQQPQDQADGSTTESNDGDAESSSESSESSESSDEDLLRIPIIRNCGYDSIFYKKTPRPFALTPTDSFCLDPAARGPGDIVSEDDKEMMNFTRNITLFPNGSSIKKFCVPFGEESLLCNRYVTLLKKIFCSNGTIIGVCIAVNNYVNGQQKKVEYTINTEFFQGWADNKAMDAHDEFNRYKK